MEYKYNLLRSPDDIRDYRSGNRFSAFELPEELDYRPLMLPIRDQGTQGACVAMSAAAMKEFQDRTAEHLSPQFIYNNREDPQEGMIMRDLLRILTNYGVCIEPLCKYGTDGVSEEAYTNALGYKIKGYARVYNVAELKATLFLQGPCIIAVPVYNSESRIWYRKDNEELLGGHAMCVVGYNKEGFIIRNSWGYDWGDGGYCYMPYSDLGYAWEVWGTIDDDTVIEPKPTTTKKCWLKEWFKKTFSRNE